MDTAYVGSLSSWLCGVTVMFGGRRCASPRQPLLRDLRLPANTQLLLLHPALPNGISASMLVVTLSGEDTEICALVLLALLATQTPRLIKKNA